MNKGLEVIEARWLFDVGPRPDRRRRASAVGRPLDGGADRRLDHRAARRHRHAAADPIRLLVSGTLDGAAAVPGPGPGRRGWISSCRTLDAFPVPRPWPSARSKADPGLPIVLNAANEVAVAALSRWPVCFPGIGRPHLVGDGRVRAARQPLGRQPRGRPRRSTAGPGPSCGVRRRNHCVQLKALGPQRVSDAGGAPKSTVTHGSITGKFCLTDDFCPSFSCSAC